LNILSKDGALVPVTLVYKVDAISTPRKGNPLFLKGYGAYGSILGPKFDQHHLSLLNRGFIIGIAHIRGGGIRGKKWFDDGRLLSKQNTFQDFFSCCEYLIENKWTKPELLAVYGRSAGGALMGAVITQRPKLVKVVLTEVPFLDIINTMSDRSISWVVFEYPEWGDPNNQTVFNYIKQYDPYKNLIPSEYPNIFILSGLADTRVMYWEHAKFIAKLRKVKTSTNTVVLVTLDAGHFGASGLDEFYLKALQYSFIIDKIGTPLPTHTDLLSIIGDFILCMLLFGFSLFSIILNSSQKNY